MKPITRRFAIATAVVLLQAVTPSWGTEPSSPTDSDPQALSFTSPCSYIAFSFQALLKNSGDAHTAADAGALGSNIVGNCHAAVGTGALLSSRDTDRVGGDGVSGRGRPIAIVHPITGEWLGEYVRE